MGASSGERLNTIVVRDLRCPGGRKDLCRTKGYRWAPRLSTFDAKNRRSNGPRNYTFAIIKEAIDVTACASTFLAEIRQIYRRDLTKRPELFLIQRGGRWNPPATVTITCAPYLI